MTIFVWFHHLGAQEFGKKGWLRISLSHGLVAITAPDNPALIHWPLNAIDTTRDMTHTQSIQTGAPDEVAKIPKKHSHSGCRVQWGNG